MAWQDDLLPASLGGVAFGVNKHTAKGGLRLAKHEFPGGDVGLVHNLGQKLSAGTIDAFVLGEGYMRGRDALLAAVRSGKPSTLVHPWLGQKTVLIEDWTLSETTEEGGYCVVALEWIEVPQAPPLAQADALAQAQTCIGVAGLEVKSDFAQGMRYADELQPKRLAILDVVRTGLDALQNALQFLRLPGEVAQPLLASLWQIRGDLDGLLRSPQSYAQALRSLLGAVADADFAPQQRARVVLRLADGVGAGAASLPNAVADKTDVLRTAPAVIEQRLRERLALLASAQIAIARVYDSAGQTQAYQTTGQVRAVMAALTQGLERQLHRASGSSPAVFQALVALRTTVIAVLQQQLQALRSDAKDVVVQPLPSVVLAHRYQMDEAVFNANNRVRHPLFVQGEVLYAE